MIYMGECGGYEAKVTGMRKKRGKKALRREVDEEGHLKIHGGLSEGIRITIYSHGPMD